MKNILSKKRIRQIKEANIDNPEIVMLTGMAERHRQHLRNQTKRKNAMPKKYLRSTDYLSVKQFTDIMSMLTAKAERSRQRTSTLTRAILNEIIVIVLVESGVRATELCNLKIKDTPFHHGKSALEIRCGKGGKARTIGISAYLQGCLNNYIQRYHKGHSSGSWLFKSERGGQITYKCIYHRIKNIGLKAGIWLYHHKGVLCSRLSPHKFRHTFATQLLDVCDNELLVQSQLGHEKADTTAIYAKTLTAKQQASMNAFHDHLWRSIKVKKTQTQE